MQVIGIDISKDRLDCAWLRDIQTLRKKSKKFENSPKGHQELIAWAEKNTGVELTEIMFVMEATGVYHERLAYRLYHASAQVAVVNPAQVKAYGKSLGVRTKTDKMDSVVLARFGAKESPRLWQPEPPEIRELKALLARLEALGKDIQRERNRLEKTQISAASDSVKQSIENVIASLSDEKKRLEKDVNDHIDRHPQLKRDKELLESIPGVGDVLSRCMVAVFRSRAFSKASQMAAYLGLNPIEHESGSSIRGRPRLSKAGNANVRAKLYMPAVVSIQWNPDAKAIYRRLLANGKSKMSALGAVMRKLVHICFGVLKHQQVYSPQVTVK